MIHGQSFFLLILFLGVNLLKMVDSCLCDPFGFGLWSLTLDLDLRPCLRLNFWRSSGPCGASYFPFLVHSSHPFLSISSSSVSINGICHEPQGVVIHGNDLLENRTSSDAPLRLTGGGDTSFECQDDVDVNFQSTSSPSLECREIVSSM